MILRARVILRLDADLVLTHKEGEVEDVLDGLSERVRVDDEAEVGESVGTALLENLRDLCIIEMVREALENVGSEPENEPP